MAIVNTVTKISPGLMSPAVYAKKESVTNALNATTTTTFSNANLSAIPNFHFGYLRIKTLTTIATAYPGTGAGVCSAITVTVSDGTNTVKIYNQQGSYAASDLFDITIPFCCDIDATTLAIAVTMTNVANGQLVTDFEVGVCQ